MSEDEAFPCGTLVANNSFRADGGLVSTPEILGGRRLPALVFRTPLPGNPDAEFSIVFADGRAFSQMQKAMAELNTTCAFPDDVREVDLDAEDSHKH